jgi:hypothetical protein
MISETWLNEASHEASCNWRGDFVKNRGLKAAGLAAQQPVRAYPEGMKGLSLGFNRV